jgi:MerR family transcriptional regulator, thiopeptide resistance regulator
MDKQRLYQIREVSELARVSIRALRHYDDIGLLTPTDRTSVGYRLYDESDLLRLQQIMLGRSMGQSLEDIRKTLGDPGFDQIAYLRAHKQRLLDQVQSQHAMIASVDGALAQLTHPQERPKMEKTSYFDGFEPELYEAEVEDKWGETDAYKISHGRAKSRTPDDTKVMMAEQSAIFDDGAKAMARGELPTSVTAQAVVVRHRDHVSRWHYPLTPAMHVALADMWEADARFAGNIDRHGEGLTAWLAAAVRVVWA